MKDSALPKEKQTALNLYVTAVEAYEMWRAAPQTVKIVDVRTLEEFIFVGHPTMAWNVPIFTQTSDWDEAGKQFKMKPTADFVARVREIAGVADCILATCRSGGRGAMAVNALAKAGFTNVYNIVDGVEGDTVGEADSVFLKKRMKNGWKNAGLPWDYDLDLTRIRIGLSKTEGHNK